MNREILGRLIKAMFAILILGFLYAMFVGLSPSETQNDAAQVTAIEMPLGQTELKKVSGRLLWITRLSNAQRQVLLSMDQYLVDPEGGCSVQREFCAIRAASSQAGINLSFSENAPPQVPAQMPWTGGFVDPVTGAAFDLLGRNYRLGGDEDGQQVTIEVLD